MPEYPIYDADGTEVQVGAWLTGLRPGTIHAPGARWLSGQVQSLRPPQMVVGQVWVTATYNHERRGYELAGTCGTWERGFYSWGLRVGQPPTGGAHG